jgi:site-specific recombinase XerC
VSQAAINSIQAPDTIVVNLPAFLRSLRAEYKSEKTIETYRESVVQLAAFLAAQGMPDDIRHLKRDHIEAWIIDLPAAGSLRPSIIAIEGCRRSFAGASTRTSSALRRWPR